MAKGKTHEDAKLVIEAISQICSRARRVSSNVLQALGKRLGELALQLQHNGALACIVLLHNLIQQSKPVSSLLEPDPESGSGPTWTPSKIFEQYDGSQMAFKPAVPPPNKGEQKTKTKLSHAHSWAQPELKNLCESVENSVDMKITSVR